MTTGRTGTDFFQSLLDGHSQILQLTGSWFFHRFWEEAVCKDNLIDLVNEFVWHSCSTCNHIAKFKSYHNRMERWDQLGVNKDEFFEVDIDTFKDHMLHTLTDRELNSKNFFLAVNMAYGLTTKVDIMKTKILFYHIHHIKKIVEFKEDFPDFDVICMVRDPRNLLVSGIENWKRFNIKKYDSNFIFQILKRIFDESEPLLQYTENIKTMKLEDLHLFHRKVFEEFCSTYGLEVQDTMYESAYHGKKWWGDQLSVKYIDGFNRNIDKQKWQDKLFFHDNLLLEFILEDRLKYYGYPQKNKIHKIYLILVFFLVFLPMKYELKVFAHSFRNSVSAKARAASVKNCGKYYVMRISLYHKFILKKARKKIFLANSFLQKKYC